MKFMENRETYTKIATLYYLGEMSQNEIADIFKISRFKVSRILKKCRTLKIVEFKLSPNPIYFTNLENEIEKRLGITKAIIVPSGSLLQESKENVARMAAEYLETKIKDGMKIGISWGSTIQLTAKYYNSKNSLPNTLFVQLSGSLCSRPILGDGYIDGNIFVQQIAAKANAGWSLFIAPYVVQNPSLKDLLYQEPQIQSHVSLFKELDMALIGIGADDPSRSVSYISGYLSNEETKKLVDDNMSADLCGTRITPEGEIRETILSNRVLTIDLMDLHKLPDVCAIGAGAEKASSFIAGCLGGFIKYTIMDEVCALTILNKLDHNKNDDNDKLVIATSEPQSAPCIPNPPP